MVKLITCSVLPACAAALLLAGPAHAQVPSVGFVFPPGAQVNTTAKVNVGGGNLQGATAVLISGEGVEAKITANTEAASLPVELNVSPNAVPGERQVRVVTPRGTSNAGRLWVGAFPEVNETEPNNTVAAPHKLEKLPITVNGQVNGGEDADYFLFQANAGDTYVFDLVSYRMSSALDGYLSLYDARGKALQSTLEAFDRDPRIIHTFKSSGTYAIQVRDTLYRGGANFVYKLTVGKVPVITGYLPMGGKRGETVNLALQGVNLGAMTTMSVQIPAAGDEEVMVQPNTPAGPSSSPIRLTASDLYETVESEPNDTPAQATPAGGAPVVINGRIDKTGDRDVFRIKPEAAGNLAFDLYGRRIGSRIDSFVRIMDATGKDIQANDDAVGKDSRIVFGVQANTEYLVEVRNLVANFGGEVFYRLQVSPVGGQDFKLTVTPDAVNVGQSGSTVVTVNVARVNGFAGPLELRIEGLPAGLTLSPAAVPAGANTAQFTLTAAADAVPGAIGKIRVIGKATIDGNAVERVAQPVESFVPPLAQPDQARQRTTEIHTATVMPQQAYALDIEPRQLTVKKGTQNVEVKVKAIRQMGQNAAITIAAAGQPANVAPVVTPIPQDQKEVVVKFNVAANAPAVTQNVIITGNLSNNVQAAPALTLTITD
jgi:hypothetical protein